MVLPVDIFVELQVTLTDAMVDVEELERKLAPPQPTIEVTPVKSRERNSLRFIFRSAFLHRASPQFIHTSTSQTSFATAVNSGDAKARSLHICNEQKVNSNMQNLFTDYRRIISCKSMQDTRCVVNQCGTRITNVMTVYFLDSSELSET